MDAAARSQLRWGLGVIVFFVICGDIALLFAPGGSFSDFEFLFFWAFFNFCVFASLALARFYKAI